MGQNEEDRIAKLWGHMKNMSPDELRGHVRDIRSDRRKRKMTATAKRKAAAPKEPKAPRSQAKPKVKSLVEGMTPEQIAALIARLEK